MLVSHWSCLAPKDCERLKPSLAIVREELSVIVFSFHTISKRVVTTNVAAANVRVLLLLRRTGAAFGPLLTLLLPEGSKAALRCVCLGASIRFH